MGQQTLVWVIENRNNVDTHTDAPFIRPPLPLLADNNGIIYQHLPSFPFLPLTPNPILYPSLKKNVLPPYALLVW